MNCTSGMTEALSVWRDSPFVLCPTVRLALSPLSLCATHNGQPDRFTGEFPVHAMTLVSAKCRIGARVPTQNQEVLVITFTSVGRLISRQPAFTGRDGPVSCLLYHFNSETDVRVLIKDNPRPSQVRQAATNARAEVPYSYRFFIDCH